MTWDNVRAIFDVHMSFKRAFIQIACLHKHTDDDACDNHIAMNKPQIGRHKKGHDYSANKAANAT